MDLYIENKFIKILYFFISAILTFIIIFNLQDFWLPVFLSGLYIFFFTVRHVIISANKLNLNIHILAFLIDILLVFLINYYDAGSIAGMYYFIIIADVSYSFSKVISGSISVLCIISFLCERALYRAKHPQEGSLYLTSLYITGFILFYVIMRFIKYEMTQRQKLSETMYQLKVNTKKLEDAYIMLQDASIEIEEMTVISERNKIAREIHDTVGHTLTTALIEIEAGEKLLTRNLELAAEKLMFAKSQIRNGLSSIRESVGMLSSGKELMELTTSLKLLLDETSKHGDIFISYEIHDIPKLSKQQEKTLYRALQEGITNGIRHGGSTAFVFRLQQENDNVLFFLEDNGKGCDKIVPGFGLTAMAQRVKEVGGILNIDSANQEGCSISICIPIREDVINDADQNNYRR